MSPALTILLITISGASPDDTGAADDPYAPAIVRATREALGANTQIVSKRFDALPSDAEVVALGADVHADAVVEVTWSLPDHLRTTIRMERTKTGQWLDREVGFRPNDDPAERSRTVGFTIASMLPEGSARTETPPAKPDEPVPVPVPVPVRDSGAAHPAAEPREERLHHDNSISAAALVAFGVGDGGGGFGAVLDYRRALVDVLSLRFGVGARVGQGGPPGLTTRGFSGAVGLAWDAFSTQNGRGRLGLRLDALFDLAQFEHVAAGGATATRYKFLPGAALLAEASYFFTPGAAVVVGGGAEALFGETDVLVAGEQVAAFEPVHPVVELGLRAGF
jgi:hypothetical protein